MELAQYYGGAPSGGAFSGGMFRHSMMNPMYGGVGKKTGRTNRSSDYMTCKKKAYQDAMSEWRFGVREEKPSWVSFDSGCQKGTRQARLKTDASRLARNAYAKSRRVKKKAGTFVSSRLPCNVRGQIMSLPELKTQAKLMGISGYSKMLKADLCREIDARSYLQ